MKGNKFTFDLFMYCVNENLKEKITKMLSNLYQTFLFLLLGH